MSGVRVCQELGCVHREGVHIRCKYYSEGITVRS